MTPWSNTETAALLDRLLGELDERLASDPPDEIFIIENIKVAWPEIKACLQKSLADRAPDCCHAIIEEMARNDSPFIIFSHQFGVLRNLMLRLVLDRDTEEAKRVFTLVENLEEDFAAVYLRVFLNRLATRNHLRLSHIHGLSDKNLLVYFEAHLEWMARLVDAVAARRVEGMPEPDPTRCEFGRWLNENDLIRDRSHHSQIRRIHEAMHHVVDEVRMIMEHQRASAPIYALLKKAEVHSLELGNEVSLLNNRVIMSVYNKDPLTGFLSRRFMDRVLLNQMEIAKATETAFSLVMFDLDHFKCINDTYGHPTGDRLLEHVAALVRETLRQSDLVFRYGGEEFLLVLPSTPLAQAQQLAERLRRQIEEKPLPAPTPITASASFGVTEISPDGYTVVDSMLVRDLLAQCDAKLYAAKHLGRNRVV